MTTTRSPRYTVQFQVVYDDGTNYMAGHVIDMSESGMFIETVMPLPPGSRVRITPLLPEQVGLFELDAVVMRKADYDLDNNFDRTPGMGVCFEDVSPDALEHLRRLFARSGSPR